MPTDAIALDQMQSIAQGDCDAMAGIQNLLATLPTGGNALTVNYMHSVI